MTVRKSRLPTGHRHGERYTKHQTEACRAKIQTSNIIHRLQKHLAGDVELSPTQIRCAEILLNKSLANLTATEITGEVAQFVIRVPEPAATMADWEAKVAARDADQTEGTKH
jgi:hypothetical protein